MTAAGVVDGLRRVNRGVAYLVGGLLLACAAVVMADILLRQVGASFGGTDEISGYVMAIATSWGMAYTLLELGHIRIDLIRRRPGARGRAFFDIFAMLATSAVVISVAVMCWPVLARSLANGSRANTPLETPPVLVQAPWFAGWVWFAAMCCVTTLAALAMVMRGDLAGSERTVGAFGEGSPP
jgi:TRAP-type C4-dicarboxylate transport system permease small subunit